VRHSHKSESTKPTMLQNPHMLAARTGFCLSVLLGVHDHKSPTIGASHSIKGYQVCCPGRSQHQHGPRVGFPDNWPMAQLLPLAKITYPTQTECMTSH
jgi:hypothetical protein